jgi:hypothetical protein
VVGGSNVTDRAIDNRHMNTGWRGFDRRAAEQSARHSGHRDPTDLSAGSQWGFRTDADGCASCCRRFCVRRAIGEQHRVRERRAGAVCRRSLRGAGAGYPWLGGAAAGSLAEGRADPYSDVDLLWDVPDAAFAGAIASLPVFMARVRPLASLRFDPDFQHSARRRLAFVRFSGVPLFWRVDLDVFARSVGRDPDYDRDNPFARGTSWSLAESSLANAIAAIKAQRRGRDTESAELLTRAEARIGVASPAVDLQSRIGLLVDAVAGKDSTTTSLAADIHRLLTETT